MKTIGAARFKEQCLALLDSLDEDGLVVTKRGKPVARLLPYGHQHGELIGSLRHKVKIEGSILSTNVDWDAES
ncbi:MAG: type II toxin-antitoxin system Phd/YefM family antitoxin [Gammaproteobacteria bacterium]|nr:type II toxin-antitoxin system Phd/YefM family antitoxin [Gammaproteobacteria bacterium]